MLLIIAGCSKRIVLNEINLSGDSHAMFGKTPERNFYNDFTLGDSLKLKWETDTKGSYKNTSLIFLDEIMFASDLAGRVYAFNIESGKGAGEEKNKGAVSIAPVLYNSIIVYVVEEFKEKYSTIYFYDYYTGDYINEHIINGSCGNELIKTDDAILLISENGILYNYNLSGNERWKLDTQSKVRCVPALTGDTFIFGSVTGEITAVSLSRQKVIYKNKISDRIQSGITIENGRGYVGDDAGYLYCFDIADGEVIWSFDTGAKIVSIPVMNDEDLFVGNLSGDLFSLDKKNGEMNWLNETGGIINTTPLLFSDYLVQPDLFKKIHFVDIENGEIDRQIETDGRMKLSPVYFNGVIYFGMDKGEILAYELLGGDK